MGENKKLEKPKISVSLVVYNNSIEELKIALKGVITSDLVLNIYIVDNSQTEDLKILESLSKKIIYLFQGKNLGFGRAHNIAIKEAINHGYRYHLILNPDVEFKSDVISELFNFMENRTSCGLVMPKVLYNSGEIQHLCKKIPSPLEIFGKRLPIKRLQEKINYSLELRKFNQDTIMNIPYLSGCFLFCRVESFKRSGLFDERYFMYMEDLDFTRSFHKYFETIYYPYVSIKHGYRSESKTNKRLLISHIISAIKYFNKYGWFIDSEREKINIDLIRRLKTHNTSTNETK